jgi:imidazole glycerol-phosphate synthase subunit HisF
MYRPRIIPFLLLKDSGLVKSVKFKNHRYIGDPINIVKIFNDLKADELAFVDIKASHEKRTISLDFVKKVGEEANMPFSVGGGIRSIKDIKKIIEVGAEKVILNSIAGENPGFVKEAVEAFGSSTITVCIDIKKDFFGKNKIKFFAGDKSLNQNPTQFARLMESMGAGEIIIQSIDRDGTMNGYDIELVKEIAEQVSIPVTALGGAGSLMDLRDLYQNTCVNGLAAGSLFVYHGPRRAVLVNYPAREEIREIVIVKL